MIRYTITDANKATCMLRDVEKSWRCFFMTYKDLYCNESSQEENFEDVVRCDFLGVFLNVENNLVSIETRVKEVFERGKCKYLSICNVFIDF